MPEHRSLAGRYGLTLLLVGSLLLAVWYALGRPQTLPGALSDDQRLQCASYSPFDHDQSPFDQPLAIRQARLEADVALLAKRFDCLRTYSVTGLEALPEIARRHGMTLMIGAWVSADSEATREEIEGLVRTANAHPDVISAVIVGNEVLLRGDSTPARLKALIEEVGQRVQQPVTYAEVWEFWLRYPKIGPAVDFVTLHLLPYWEDDPTGIDAALTQVEKVHERFTRIYGSKPIFIGETGWPSQGRQREDALPSRVNEARFMRGFIALAERQGWQYNLIEAFDQPWKRISEGTVGGYWGLYDAQRQDKGILSGAVSNLPDWPRWLTVSAALLLAGLWLAGAPRKPQAAWQVPTLAGIAALSLGLWLQQMTLDSRHVGEWLWQGALALLNLPLAAWLLVGCNPPSAGWRAGLERHLQQQVSRYWLVVVLAASLLMLAQVFDPRYRSFPSLALLLPALAVLLRPCGGPRLELGLCALLLSLGLVAVLWQETLLNTQALGWTAVSLLLLAALWRGRTRHNGVLVSAVPNSLSSSTRLQQ